MMPEDKKTVALLVAAIIFCASGVVALADEAANTVLQSAATNYTGWPDLPDGVEEKARITVRRGQ